MRRLAAVRLSAPPRYEIGRNVVHPFKPLYKGLKGCTTFRPNPVTGAVLSEQADGSEAPHCCVLEREPD